MTPQTCVLLPTAQGPGLQHHTAFGGDKSSLPISPCQFPQFGPGARPGARPWALPSLCQPQLRKKVTCPISLQNTTLTLSHQKQQQLCRELYI